MAKKSKRTSKVADAGEETPKKKKKTSTPRAAKQTKKAAAPQPTDEEIQIRAYFISERRHRLALPGDAGSDWIEARRQLLSEGPAR